MSETSYDFTLPTQPGTFTLNVPVNRSRNAIVMQGNVPHLVVFEAGTTFPGPKVVKTYQWLLVGNVTPDQWDIIGIAFFSSNSNILLTQGEA